MKPFRKYHIDDVLQILRPPLYIYAVMKCGRKSYFPIKVCMIMDIVSIAVSFYRLSKGSNKKGVKNSRMRSVER